MKYGEAPAGIKEVFELCRGFERAYMSFVMVSPATALVYPKCSQHERVHTAWAWTHSTHNTYNAPLRNTVMTKKGTTTCSKLQQWKCVKMDFPPKSPDPDCLIPICIWRYTLQQPLILSWLLGPG